MQTKPSRSVSVAFFNETSQSQLSKVDELGTGAAYCQLFDSIFGDVPMHRVVFDTRSTMAMETNYKILQQAFSRHNVAHNFDPTRLIKCRLQDNLEFAQWFYQFWHETPHIPDYDPVSRRRGAPPVGSVPNALGIRRAPSMMQPPALKSHTSATPQPKAADLAYQQRQHKFRHSPNLAQAVTPARTPRMQNANLGNLGNHGNLNMHRRSTLDLGAATAAQAASYNQPLAEDPRIAMLMQEVQDSRGENEELIRTTDVAVSERDVYYSKSLEVEYCIKCELERSYEPKEGSASIVDPQDPTILFIRRLQACVCYPPEGFQTQPTPDDEPF